MPANSTSTASKRIESIGTDSGCNIVVPEMGEIAPLHALLRRNGDRVFIKDLGSTFGTFIDERQITAHQWHEVIRQDALRFGRHEIRLGNLLFSSSDRLGLNATPLKYATRRGTLLCDGAYLAATPGTVTAIMGPSGCGKTVFLNLLAGCLAPTAGCIGLSQPGMTQSWASRKLGYVEQFEAFHPELTVRQSLDYKLMLRFPDMEHRVRDKLIKVVCKEMRLGETGLELFLNRIIDAPGSGLSGGERRRVHIAHDLVLQPPVLLLDEPTAGLSSHESELIMTILKDAAKNLGISVVTTLHHPNQEMLARVDHVLLLAPGGRPAYYGSVANLEPYLQSTFKLSPRPHETLGDITLRLLSTSESCAIMTAMMISPTAENATRLIAPPSVIIPPAEAATPSMVHSHWEQFAALCRRSVRILWNEPSYFGVAVAVAGIIALLICVTFLGFQSDNPVPDRFLRTLWVFHELKAPYQTNDEPVPVDALLREAAEKSSNSHGNSSFITTATAHVRLTIHYLMVAAATWFGVMAGCREIVAEKLALRREFRAGLCNIVPYLLSKIAILSGVVLVQVLIVAITVGTLLLDMKSAAVMDLIARLFAVGVTSVCIGLGISTVSKSLRTALTVVPLVLLPQLLLGGLLRMIPVTTNFTDYLRNVLVWCNPQHWGFILAMQTDPYAQNFVLEQTFSPDASGRYSKLEFLSVRETGLSQIYFHATDETTLAAVSLLTIALVVLVISFRTLNKNLSIYE